MSIRRVQRKIDRTPEELAQLRADREAIQRNRPNEDALLDSGDYDGPFRHADVMAFLTTIATLQQERQRQGLSLAELSDRSGLDKGMLSRLENGKILNPTIATLWKYADALGMRLSMSCEKAIATTSP